MATLRLKNTSLLESAAGAAPLGSDAVSVLLFYVVQMSLVYELPRRLLCACGVPFGSSQSLPQAALYQKTYEIVSFPGAGAAGIRRQPAVLRNPSR